jgi:hypothetical protein
MRVVRTPAIARRIFSSDQISGWHGLWRYEYTPPKSRRKKPKADPEPVNHPPVPAVVVSGGVEI